MVFLIASHMPSLIYDIDTMRERVQIYTSSIVTIMYRRTQLHSEVCESKTRPKLYYPSRIKVELMSDLHASSERTVSRNQNHRMMPDMYDCMRVLESWSSPSTYFLTGVSRLDVHWMEWVVVLRSPRGPRPWSTSVPVTGDPFDGFCTPSRLMSSILVLYHQGTTIGTRT